MSASRCDEALSPEQDGRQRRQTVLVRDFPAHALRTWLAATLGYMTLRSESFLREPSHSKSTKPTFLGCLRERHRPGGTVE